MFGLKRKQDPAPHLTRAQNDQQPTKSVGVGNVAPRVTLDFLPRGTILKRIHTRNSKDGNNWRVSHQSRTTEYYAPTLQGAIEKFLKHNSDMASIYHDNKIGHLRTTINR